VSTQTVATLAPVGVTRAAIGGWSLCLPERDPPPLFAGLVAPMPDARTVLGRKGLLYKETATRLALCAVHAALGYPTGVRPAGALDPRTAVVACANLGNVETVVEVAKAVRAGGVREVSPLAAPNASSNVLASTVALWFGLAGPNLMVCSGATAGLDGLAIALRLLRADRADRVVLVGAEPADPVATALHAGTGPYPLAAGAACVVLGGPGEVFVESGGTQAGLVLGPGGLDPAAFWGDGYGAQGVISLALATAAVAAGRCTEATVHCGAAADGWKTATVRSGTR
jgi:3-oxoacyl-[acyl-carrier-protein] synthase II